MSIFTDKRLSVVLHLAGWIIIFLLPAYLISAERRPDVLFMGRIFIRTAIYAILFYLSYFWLIPGLLFRGKRITYYLSVFVLVTGLYFVNELANRTFFVNMVKIENRKPDDNRRSEQRRKLDQGKRGDRVRADFKIFRRFDVYNFLLTSFLVSGFSVGLRMSGKYNENEKKRKELEKEKLSSELAFLKNQVSPHFFFNTLNNIYSLVEINTQEARNAILQLSKLMRYLLYESEKGDTKLSNEIAFMKNYIDLMKLRLSDKVTLEYSFPEIYKDISVPPLIFIPFIENAFKHGVSYRDKSFVNIRLEMHDDELRFRCVNSIYNNNKEQVNSGIGLENVKKRLALLFPGSHELTIRRQEEVFEVLLVIHLIHQTKIS